MSAPTVGPVAARVREFYSEHPFPDFDLARYASRSDLESWAGPFARQLDRQIAPDARIVDVGCGTGQMSCYLGLRGRTVLGVDLVPASLAKAEALRDRLALDGVRFEAIDLMGQALPPEQFDVVFCNGVLHHTADPELGFSRLCDAARPGGHVLVGLYNRSGRLALRLRRALYRRLGSPDGRTMAARLRRLIRSAELDDRRAESWYHDQFLHPHEQQHSVGEALGWFEAHGLEYVSSQPPIEWSRGRDGDGHLFRRTTAAPPPPWAVRMVEWSWTWSERDTGGFFMLVGRKRRAASEATP